MGYLLLSIHTSGWRITDSSRLFHIDIVGGYGLETLLQVFNL